MNNVSVILVMMEVMNSISYTDLDSHEYDFPNFTVCITPETSEIAHITFKKTTVSADIIPIPWNVLLRNHYGNFVPKSGSRKFYIAWNSDYILEEGGSPLLNITCERNQRVSVNSECLSYF